jgi:hypothetical protein
VGTVEAVADNRRVRLRSEADVEQGRTASLRRLRASHPGRMHPRSTIVRGVHRSRHYASHVDVGSQQPRAILRATED